MNEKLNHLLVDTLVEECVFDVEDDIVDDTLVQAFLMTD